MKELHLSIVSPEKSIFDGNVKIVTLPGMIGSFSILPGPEEAMSGDITLQVWTNSVTVGSYEIRWIFRAVLSK